MCSAHAHTHTLRFLCFIKIQGVRFNTKKLINLNLDVLKKRNVSPYRAQKGVKYILKYIKHYITNN